MSGSRRAVRRPVAGVLCALALLSACRAEGDGVRVDLERMIDQPKYLPYGESTVFADGRAMQPPPAGTLPYDAEVPAPAMSTGREEGAVVEGIPLRVTLGMLEAGRERFEVYCAACHGVGGDGESPVAAKMELRPPPSFHTPEMRARPAGHFFRVASEGYGLMPAYAADLTPAERWAVVAYIRALQLSRYAPLDSLPAGLREEALRVLGAPPPAAAATPPAALRAPGTGGDDG